MGNSVGKIFDFLFPPPKAIVIPQPYRDYVQAPPRTPPYRDYVQAPPRTPPYRDYVQAPYRDYPPVPKFTKVRDLNVCPTLYEITGISEMPIDSNIIQGAFSSLDHYLSIHFRLLREDFVSPLRESLTSPSCDKIIIHNLIRFRKIVDKKVHSLNAYAITLDHATMRSIEDKDSKRFMMDTLLIFTRNNYASVVLTTVQSTKAFYLSENEIHVEVQTGSVYSGDYLMVECLSYFAPYLYALRALKSMVDLPMSEYILYGQNCMKRPNYLGYFGYSIDGRSCFPHEVWPSKLCMLNDAQVLAFKAALTEKFVLIQGPPGTGKTHLGRTIARVLIQNAAVWHRGSPILLVSYKNEAVDHVLEGLIPYTSKILRVGSQSNNEKLQQFNLIRVRNKYKQSTNVKFVRNVDLMRKALIVGMTTTCAARMKEDLDELRCPIVFFEEAAEVFEAHVVASMSPGCEQLILVGDHKQLKPLVNDHKLAAEHHLDVSLFERMVNNNVRSYVLNVQHRMRPEISALLRLIIYPFLVDAPSVLNRPNVAGVAKNIFFLHHEKPETAADKSFVNNHESKFLVALARHLVHNGHKAESITILALYSAQTDKIKSELARQKKFDGGDIQVTTLDGFQGQENDIVLLSLVRNNSRGNIGFLSKENRVCVALSRARNGLYVMGNINLLIGSSTVWGKIRTYFVDQNSLDTSLPLLCRRHGQFKAKIPSNFGVNGGCHKICNAPLNCGHHCQEKCHLKYEPVNSVEYNWEGSSDIHCGRCKFGCRKREIKLIKGYYVNMC